MREIKFRAWHKLDNELVYFKNEKLVNDQYQMQYLARLMRGDYGDVLMQYTGLKDVDGTEIYEGDIVSFRSQKLKKYITGEVEYICAEFRISHDYGNPLLGGDVYDVKVIGNIYENPELKK